MSLGRMLGEYELRIAELEERLAAKAATKRAEAQMNAKRGVWDSIRECLQDADAPMSVDEMAERIPQFPRKTIALNVGVRVAKRKGLARVYEGAIPKYRLTAKAGEDECHSE